MEGHGRDEGPPVSAIDEALSDVGKMLAADGYVLRIDDYAHGHLRLVLEAGADACAECLVPKPVMEGIVRAKLGAGSAVTDIEVVYPAEADHQA